MNDAIFRLVKDVLLSVGAVAISAILLVTTQDESVVFALFMGLFFAGVPFGWRFLSKFISALSLVGIVLKFMGAIIIGWIALPITLIKDVVVLIFSIVDSATNDCEEVV